MPVQGLWWSLCHCFFWFPWCINLKSNMCSHQLTSESEFVVWYFAMQIMNSKGGVCECFSDFSGHPGINALNFADRYVSGSERTELPSIGRALANDDRYGAQHTKASCCEDFYGGGGLAVARSSVESKFTLLDVFWRPFHNIIPFLRIPQKKITYNF